MRNPAFHRKFWALIAFAFEQWSDGASVEYNGQTVRPNIDTFRRDLIILAGYSELVVKINGSVRVEAKSISFANMDQEQFEKLYFQAINVILEKILYGKGYTEEKLRQLVDRTMDFA
jgi:hypothetical protein